MEAQNSSYSDPTLHGQPNKKTTKRPRILLIVLVSIFVISIVAAFYFAVSNDASRFRSEPTQKSSIKEGDINSIAETVLPSVVSITTETIDLDESGETEPKKSAGSGFIVRNDGLIITNRHVVEGASSVSVITHEGQLFEKAKVVGIYPFNDIAFIKIEGKDLPTLEIGDSDQIKVGERVVAVGNALGVFQNSVTTGIISSVNRPLPLAINQQGSVYDALFQIDAAINPGNSGGPLFNMKGQVIGINSAGATEAENIGFSIPINQAKGGLNSLINSGKFDVAFLGVSYRSLSPIIAREKKIDGITYGALLVDTKSKAVLPGSPAEKAGLKAGDIITKINDISLKTHVLLAITNQFQPGETVTVEVFRSGKFEQMQLTLGSYIEYAANNKPGQ